MNIEYVYSRRMAILQSVGRVVVPAPPVPESQSEDAQVDESK